MAYRLPGYRISTPAWMESERYDLAAIMPPDTLDDQVLLMLQTLLVERFQLKLRWEQRETALYALMVGKNGPKLNKVAEGRDPVVIVRPFGFDATSKSMEDLAGILSRWTDRPVVDMTGVSGLYDFKLDWTFDRSRPSDEISSPLAVPVSDPTAALRSVTSLGLKIETRKAPLKFLIVDHGEKVPIEN